MKKYLLISLLLLFGISAIGQVKKNDPGFIPTMSGLQQMEAPNNIRLKSNDSVSIHKIKGLNTQVDIQIQLNKPNIKTRIHGSQILRDSIYLRPY